MAVKKQINTAETEARIDTLTLPQDGWSAASRADALTRLRAMGLPGRRDEYWKFTRPDALVQATAATAEVVNNEEAPLMDGQPCLRAVFVDGVFDADASDDLALEGIEISRLADTTADIHWAQSLHGTLETAGQTPVARPIAALVTAFAKDGLLIRVTGNPSKPVNVIYNRKSDSADVMLHHVVKLEPGASLTLLESGPAAARLNTVMEVDVADTAAFHHVRTQGRDHQRVAATHVFARLGTESTFKSFTLTANGKLTRNDCVLELTGDDAVAHVAGACVGDGDFHHDDTVFVTHDAVNCESRQVFKKVLRNGATGVFQGKILVKAGAQKTDGYQISQSLLLDGDSQFLAKPELEIYADDVACSHGSTSGAIDEEALFYLRSRGVPEEAATNLLTLAFLAEAVQEIENEDLRADIETRMSGWLERHRS
ncbi:Fe-S cluster assembly protein SufD [Sulfitobacter pseudonitzschiae]|uniref:Fe-S cluster assembly protein SufD n=1 Tax=Pseudosulfitobacter pseudonitzschiae TaxID=1402135 RepID=A0A9Q2RYP1_9RHOB|nr:Fe-S cluster assembly protein SufD [Pseudosulfitobacter pseudonitzschiae]MBM2293824.1 Fe-S cluster assembly protein SufD [Pseudosulfitobacter pseudonitzschiae]MBM2298741.1 Fe-S cluster assembly protein SufD [Pseudosulfitobacter pseudonitzschiae]MBM2303656.1 Fe-S cluster assembly protein SufD [Pseudosulfitobacter pseudonitzschiae]MBM2313438.1 Fe-S cluster assembly protein SufD [Pseudosulfitobacter pseudonitzschiae]MBM2318352.1 Fe-S cluster assembly protein SufD [Pseudosulfitobacter pseudonit